jgi:hypothetical protein
MSIEICHVCDGYGYSNITEPYPDTSVKKVTCQRCEGFGRLVRTKSYTTLRSHGIEAVKTPDTSFANSYAEVEALAWKIYDDEHIGIQDAPFWTKLVDEAKLPYRDRARAVVAKATP